MNPPKILILGGGYGGLMCAMRLQKSLKNNEAQITLISKHDYHYQTTLLHKVAIGTLSARKARIYYRKILDPKKITFIKDKVLDINPESKLVKCRRGEFSYDYLVIALGFKPETFGITGVDKYAYKLSSLNAALKLTKNIENKFKDYSITKNDNDLSIIVCGTGFTSIEFAAELATQLDDLCQICGIDRSIPKVTCIGRSEEILPIFSKSLALKAKKKLENIGVNLVKNAEVIECKEDGVVVMDKTTKTTREIKGNTILWGAGVRGNDIIEKTSFKNNKGRIAVDSTMRCKEFSNVFVVGDSAFYKNKDVIHAPTAQLSAQMGEYAGKELINLVRNKPSKKEFKFIHRGTICSIGHTDGVGVVYGQNLKGEFAAFMKNTIENRWLLKLGGLKMVYRKGQFRFRTSN